MLSQQSSPPPLQTLAQKNIQKRSVQEQHGCCFQQTDIFFTACESHSFKQYENDEKRRPNEPKPNPPIEMQPEDPRAGNNPFKSSERIAGKQLVMPSFAKPL